MHEVLVKRLGGLSLPRKSVVRLTDRPDMTLDVNRGRKTTTIFFKYNAPHSEKRRNKYSYDRVNSLVDACKPLNWCLANFNVGQTAYAPIQAVHIIFFNMNKRGWGEGAGDIWTLNFNRRLTWKALTLNVKAFQVSQRLKTSWGGYGICV